MKNIYKRLVVYSLVVVGLILALPAVVQAYTLTIEEVEFACSIDVFINGTKTIVTWFDTMKYGPQTFNFNAGDTIKLEGFPGIHYDPYGADWGALFGNEMPSECSWCPDDSDAFDHIHPHWAYPEVTLDPVRDYNIAAQCYLTPFGPTAQIDYFTATPAMIGSGQASTLEFSTFFGGSCLLKRPGGGWGGWDTIATLSCDEQTFPPTPDYWEAWDTIEDAYRCVHSYDVTPTETTTYRIDCTMYGAPYFDDAEVIVQVEGYDLNVQSDPAPGAYINATPNAYGDRDTNYTIVAVGPGTSISLTAEQQYTSSSTWGSTDYVFSHWDGCVSSTSNRTITFNMPSSDTTCVAHYIEPPNLTVQSTPDEGAYIDATPSTYGDRDTNYTIEAVLPGTSISLEAEWSYAVSSGWGGSTTYYFDYWDGCVPSYNYRTITFNMPSSDTTCVAHYTTTCNGCTDPGPGPVPSTYRLTVASYNTYFTQIFGVPITGNPSYYGDTTRYSKFDITEGTQFSLEAPATHTSGAVTYDFFKWSGCVAGSGSTSRTINLTMDSDKYCIVYYSVPLPIFYSVTVRSSPHNGIFITGDPPDIFSGTTEYVRVGNEGTQFSLQAPSSYTYGGTTYNFENWSDCVSSSSRTINVTLNENKICVANYEAEGEPEPEPEYDLTVRSSPITGISIDGTPNTYDGTTNYTRSNITEGTTLSLQAPATRTSGGTTYDFVNWTGTGCSTSNRTVNVTMNANRTCTANYEAEASFNFDLDVIPSSGTVTRPDSGTVTINTRAYLDLVSGTTQSVSLSASSLPNGVIASFPNGSNCSPDCDRTVRFTVGSNATIGTDSITITGTGGGVSRSDTYSLTIEGGIQTLEGEIHGDGTGTVNVNPPNVDHTNRDTSPEIYKFTQTYDYGELVVLSAEPDVGSTFASWGGGECSGQGDCNITMDDDYIVSATFNIDNVCTREQPTISIPDDKQYGNPGQQLTYSVAITNRDTNCAASDFQYTAVNCPALWECIIEPTSATIASQETVTAELRITSDENAACSGDPGYVIRFEATDDSVVEHGTAFKSVAYYVKCKLTTSSTAGGSVIDPGEGANYYNYGTEDITLEAQASAGYTFTEWTDDIINVADPQGNPTAITSMEDHYNIKANFVEIIETYILNVYKDGTGTGTVTSDPGNIDCGAVCSDELDGGTYVELLATADAPASYFDGWGTEDDCSGSDNPCSLTMNSAKEATAIFTLCPPPTAEVTAPESGEFSPYSDDFEATFEYNDECPGLTACKYRVISDTEQTFPATAGEWAEAGACTGTDLVSIQKMITVGPGENCRHNNSTCTVEVLAEDGAGNTSAIGSRTFHICWDPPVVIRAYWTLTISSTSGGTVLEPGEGQYTHLQSPAETVTLIAEPYDGHSFVEWTGDIANIDDPYSAATTIYVEGNYNITANFD